MSDATGPRDEPLPGGKPAAEFSRFSFDYRISVLLPLGVLIALGALAGVLGAAGDRWHSPAWTDQHRFSENAWYVVLAVSAALIGLLTLRVSSDARAAASGTSPQPDPAPNPFTSARRPHRVQTAILRWSALVTTGVAAAHFGNAAALSGRRLSIVQVELAASGATVRGCDCAAAIRTTIGHDWWFICSYVLLLGLVVCWTGANYRLATLRDLRTPLLWAIVIAGLLDVLENSMMLAGLDQLDRGSAAALAWRVAAICAWAKFALVLAAIAYSLAGAFAWWVTPAWVRLAARILPADARETAGPAPAAGTGGTSLGGGLRLTRAAAPTTEVAPANGTRRRRFGIAFSGGGIRASSISLGALQVLETAPGPIGWDAAQRITAVSGGSNMAAGWSVSRSTYSTTEEGDPDRIEPSRLSPRPWVELRDGTLTPEERHLVDNLGYLSASEPRGSATDPAGSDTRRTSAPGPAKSSFRPTAYATLLAGLVVNSVVLLSMLWAVTRPLGWFLRSLVDPGTDGTGRVLVPADIRNLVSERSLLLPGPTFLLLGFILLMLWVLAGQWLVPAAERFRPVGALMTALASGTRGAFVLGALLLLALGGFVALVGVVAGLSGGTTNLGTLAGSLGVLASVGRVLKKPAARFAPMLGGVLFIAVGLLLAAWWTWLAAQRGPTWPGASWHMFSGSSGWNWLAALVLLALVQFLVSPERWSMAPFYRSKLRLAYATYRAKSQAGRGAAEQQASAYLNDNATRDRRLREPGLSAFTQPGVRTPTAVTTPLLVCATTTVSSRAVRTYYGTPALSVTFSPAHVTLHLPQDDWGSWLDYKAPTAIIDRLGRPTGKRITTMMAAALSSAAVSPAMGRFRIGPTSMLLTFFNIRLGAWIPNPRYGALLETAGVDPAARLGYPRTGLGYLFKEFFGIHDLDDPYLYVTDGGHWENTGLVELLRNRDISEVVCIDADSGPADAADSISKAINIAPLECGVRIDISLDPLRAAPTTGLAPGYAPRTVNLGFFTDGAGAFVPGKRVGVLWYAKPGLTHDMPQSLLAFHEGRQDFPRTDTLDQFYDTSTFVAYRDLGRYNARQIVRARGILGEELRQLLAHPKVRGRTLKQRLEAMTEREDCHWSLVELARAVRRFDEVDTVAFCAAVQDSLR